MRGYVYTDDCKRCNKGRTSAAPSACDFLKSDEEGEEGEGGPPPPPLLPLAVAHPFSDVLAHAHEIVEDAEPPEAWRVA